MKKIIQFSLLILTTIFIMSFISHNESTELDGLSVKCPEEDGWNLTYQNKYRMNSSGNLMYLWKCDGNKDHLYWRNTDN